MEPTQRAVETLIRDFIITHARGVLVSFREWTDACDPRSICRKMVSEHATRRSVRSTKITSTHVRKSLFIFIFTLLLIDLKSPPTTVGPPADDTLVENEKERKRKEKRKRRPSMAEVNVIYKENSYRFVVSVQEAARSRTGGTVQAALHHRGVLSGDHHEPD